MAKLLITSLVDPATHPGGAGTYTRGLVAALHREGKGHQVTLVGPLYAPPGPWYRTRQMTSLAQSCISKFPAKVLFTRQHELKMRIRNTVRSHHFDVAFINGSDMLWVIDELPQEMPKVLIAHNLEHQLLIQQLANSRFLSFVLKHEIVKQSCYEIQGFRRVQGVIFLSSTDRNWSCLKVPGLQALVLPPMFNEPPLSRQRIPHGQLRLGLIADFAWWPNRQSWMWLIEEILPKVRRPLTVHLFGRKSKEMPADERVVAHGLVPDLGYVWDQVDIMICPIRAGAGVSIKLAESLYNRLPVLATTQAVRGLKCSSEAGLVIIDSAEEWADFLNSSEADRLATQMPSEELSREFTADRHVEKLENFIVNVAAK